LALAFKRLFGTAFIFDMRGFWADERVEGGLWKKDSWLYRTAKWFETQFLQQADTVVSLTEAGIEAIKAFDHVDTRDTRFEMIPTCVDLDLFMPQPELRQDAFVLGYVGSVGTWYCFDDVLDCFQILRERRPDARLRILNQGDHNYIADRLSEKEIDRTAVTVRSVDHDEVPVEMNRMDAGIFFYRPTFSKKGTSPTKMGEFLACDIPCLSNTGVGDVETILEGNRVGVALDSFEADEKERGIDELVELAHHDVIRGRCRAVAEDYYSLEAGVRSYDAVYRAVGTDD
jgi:glycosyltransferase involved in cell wall biosynthesis